jgi:hypothetical protein
MSGHLESQQPQIIGLWYAFDANPRADDTHLVLLPLRIKHSRLRVPTPGHIATHRGFQDPRNTGADYPLVSATPPPGFQVGKNWGFKKSESDAWLEQFRAKSDLNALVDDIVAEVTRNAR